MTCACGLPLHYSDPDTEELVSKMVAELGEFVSVKVGNEQYLVQRHFIALHGLKAVELHTLVEQGVVRQA